MCVFGVLLFSGKKQCVQQRQQRHNTTHTARAQTNEQEIEIFLEFDFSFGCRKFLYVSVGLFGFLSHRDRKQRTGVWKIWHIDNVH